MSDITIRKARASHAAVPLHPFRDKRLSNALLGMLSRLLLMPDGWKIRKQHLINMGTDGEDAISSQLKQLRGLGYLRMTRMPTGERGRFEWEYEVFETPQDPETTRDIISGRRPTTPPETMPGKSPHGQKPTEPATIGGKSPSGQTRMASQLDQDGVNQACSSPAYIDPDLTLSDLSNSLLSPLSQEIQASGSAARGIVPEAPPAAKGERGGEEKIFEEEGRRERERRQQRDPDWQGIPEHVPLERPIGLKDLAPEIRAEVVTAFSRSDGASPPGSAAPPSDPRERERLLEERKRQQAEALAAHLKAIEDGTAPPPVIPPPAAPAQPARQPITRALWQQKLQAVQAAAAQRMSPDELAAWHQREARLQAMGKANPSAAAAKEARAAQAAQAAKTREDDLAALVALPPEQLVDKLYAECLAPLNPNPAKDRGNLRRLKTWARQAAEDARQAVVLAFWQAKDAGFYSVKAVVENLAELGFTSSEVSAHA